MAVEPAGRGPRVGLLGFFIESNRWAPAAVAEDFAQTLDLAGVALGQALQTPASRLLPDVLGFARAMTEMGPWTPVPLRMAACQPSGPVDHAFFAGFVADIERRLHAAGALDAVFISGHGAAITTAIDDPDAVLFERVREAVGQDVPVVAVLDLHANLSDRLTRPLSALIAYRSNPHVDLAERGEEAARHLRHLVDQSPGVVVHVKLPFVPASTTLLSAPGTPYRELLDEAARRVGHGTADAPPVQGLLNISLCAGFAHADAAGCGFSIAVSGLRDRVDALHAQAMAMAASVWAARHRFETRLTPLAEAVAAAADCGAGQGARMILADVADNPGGGAGGHTVTLMRALHEAGVRGALVAVFCDPSLAAESHARGRGAVFDATFNRVPAPPWAPTWSCRVRVMALADGEFVGRRGLLAGTRSSMGLTARLALGGTEGGVEVVVISQRQQLLDPAQLDGLDINLRNKVRTLVAKSRGHFRAAFEGFAPASRILEVDAPGLTTPNLSHLPWTRLPRPVHPLDEGVRWPADG